MGEDSWVYVLGSGGLPLVIDIIHIGELVIFNIAFYFDLTDTFRRNIRDVYRPISGHRSFTASGQRVDLIVLYQPDSVRQLCVERIGELIKISCGLLHSLNLDGNLPVEDRIRRDLDFAMETFIIRALLNEGGLGLVLILVRYYLGFVSIRAIVLRTCENLIIGLNDVIGAKCVR